MKSFLMRYRWRLLNGLIVITFLLNCFSIFYFYFTEFQNYESSSNQLIHDYNPFNYAIFSLNFFALIVSGTYPIFIYLLEKQDLINPVSKWRKSEFVFYSLVTGLIYLFSCIEFADTNFAIALINGGFLLLVIAVTSSYFLRKITDKSFSKNKLSKHQRRTFLVAVTSIVLIFLMTYFKWKTEFNDHPIFELYFYLSNVILVILWFFVIASWIFRQWKDIRKLKNEKSKAELFHLKSQVNPHFFFNTLNNLYGLIKSDQDEARELVIDLSEMMRYTIYKGQKEEVSLKEETEYLSKYIEVHKKRYQKNVDISFNHNLGKDNMHYRLMPLLFIILVENAFKHGVENLVTDAFIHVSLIAEGNVIHFSTENNFDEKELPENPGIGLKNLKRRLELVYPDQHTLDLSKDGNIFSATLSIEIK